MITQKEWTDIHENLSNPRGHVEIEVSGVGMVSFLVTRIRPLSFQIMSYVNGSFKWVWMNAKTQSVERDICARKIVRKLFPPTKRKALKKIKGSGLSEKMFAMYSPLWPTPGGLIRHLKKVAATRDCRLIRVGYNTVNTPKFIDPPQPAAAG